MSSEWVGSKPPPPAKPERGRVAPSARLHSSVALTTLSLGTIFLELKFPSFFAPVPGDLEGAFALRQVAGLLDSVLPPWGRAAMHSCGLHSLGFSRGGPAGSPYVGSSEGLQGPWYPAFSVHMGFCNEMPRCGGLFTDLEAEKFKVRRQADFTSGKGPPAHQRHLVSVPSQGERDKGPPWSTFRECTAPITRVGLSQPTTSSRPALFTCSRS